jgi:ADP-heptose:LPS heptosyltransferase
MRQLGDVLVTLDALRELKRAKPSREVSYVVDEQFHALLENEDYIDRLLPSPPRVGSWSQLVAYINYVRRLRELDPSFVLDYHSNARSAFLTFLSGASRRVGFDVKVRKIAYNVVEPRAEFRDGRMVLRNSAETALRMARHAGAAGDGRAMFPVLEVGDEAARKGAETLASASIPRTAMGPDSNLVGINPGKTYRAKAWPEEYFVSIARTLTARGRQVVVLWGPGEQPTAARIADAAGENVWLGPRTVLSDLPGVLSNLSYLVSIDSGLKHLAVCVRVPTVTIFGSTSPREWHVGTERDGYLWRGYSCSPCRRLDCPYGAPCMSDIKPSDVLAEISRLGLEGDDQ